MRTRIRRVHDGHPEASGRRPEADACRAQDRRRARRAVDHLAAAVPAEALR
ncbi:hypothetical protein ACFPH6_35885 [Streptomyces xiangluensis]|uniref:Uncharacterized protein n=1 Tax=Streptomyces xiangluensis TaxID=2665720 RepID=A0ABV8YYI6_9ACTN